MMKCPGLAVAVSCALALVSCGKTQPPHASQDSTAAAPDTGTPAAPVPSSGPDTAPSKPETNPKPVKPIATAPASSGDTAVADAALRDAYHTAPLDTVDVKTYQGWKYFNLNCARCHGEDVLGTSIAPHLILSLKPDGPIPNEAVFLQTVCGGRPEKGMPAWCSLGMSTAQIDTIYAYVKGRSDAKIHPGRPARIGG